MRLLHASLQVALRHWALTAAAVLGAMGVLNPAAALAQAAATECNPTQMCCVASQIGGNPGCAGSGNPINVITGNKYQRETDLPALPGVLGLEIVRHYNSADSRHGSDSHIGILGRGWRLSYDIELHATGNIVTLVQADGTPVSFARGFLNPRRFLPTDPNHGHLTPLTTSRGNEYLWTRRDGHELRFDAHGRLEEIKAPTGEAVTLQRDFDGMLVSVTDPQGRSLHLHNLERKTAQATGRFGGVQHIDSPVGRFSYEYSGARLAGADIEPVHLRAQLVKVTAPGPDEGHRASRLYHYEDPRHPTLLTGISISGAGSDGKPMNQRISTWAYDDKGRANLSAKGEPARLQTDQDGKPVQPYRLVEGTGIEQVVLERSGTGKTVATNSLGQTTVFSHALIAGESKLLEVRGAGCAHCAGPNLRYGYDKFGRLTETTRITPDGQPIQTTRTALDPNGRPSIVSRIDYLAGKPQPPQPVVRYEYDGDTPAPSLIATPSVVAGREHIVRIAYNEVRQPTKVTEEGFSPLDEEGQPSARGTPISRSTSYGYSNINGRSLLTQIDGPLPNGPKGDFSDSDITQVEWDSQGSFVTTVVYPMALRETFQRDAGTGRLSVHTTADGIATRYAYLATGQVTRAERDGLVTVQRHDALGQVSNITGPDGLGASLAYDTAGRVTSIRDSNDYRIDTRFDTEGHDLNRQWFEPNASHPLRADYRWYDDAGHLKGSLRADGRIDEYDHSATTGLMTRHVDGLGNATHWLAGPASQASAVVRVGNDGSLSLAIDGPEVQRIGSSSATIPQTEGDPNLQPVQSRTDDFGRAVWARFAQHGQRWARYNDAGQLTEVRLNDGTVIRFQRDALGRLTQKKTFQHEKSKALSLVAQTDDTVTLHYHGSKLMEVIDSAQRTNFQYDSAGRLAARIVALAKVNDAAEVPAQTLATYTIRYGYDPTTGRRTSQQMADGRTLRTEYDMKTGAPRRIRLSTPGILDKLGLGRLWGSEGSSQDLLTDIRPHPFNGIVAATTGNGIETLRGHDIAGRLKSINVKGVVQLDYEYGAGIQIREHRQQWPGPRTRPARQALLQAAYRYDSRGQWQSAQTAPRAIKIGYTGAEPQASTDAAAQGEQYDSRGQLKADSRHAYTYDGQGRLVEVRRAASPATAWPIARYAYNAWGERVSKTVFDARGAKQTMYCLYEAQHLAAEIDQVGQITAQYLYVNGAPYAKLDSETAGASARTLYIHTDARGTPLAMTDPQRHIVWSTQDALEDQAWGRLNALHAPAQNAPRMQKMLHKATLGTWGRTDQRPAILNVRLAGQYFDAETGLHYNYQRYYKPSTHRYITPDPLGYPDGPDAYAYVNNDPINRVDPRGLYQEDIHYYMTFFLALAAGVPYDTARTIALAAQYVDDNPDTRPLDPHAPLNNITNPTAIRRLLSYHFVLDPSTVGADGLVDPTSYGRPPASTDIVNPDARSAQLRRLLNASETAPTDCAQYQFFGEYLHAFEDTFAHRDNQNRVYAISAGIGHGLELSHPDYTYSDDPNYQGNDPLVMQRIWAVRPVRTLEMEREVFAKLTDFGSGGHSFAEIEGFLREFNATREEGAGSADFAGKIRLLQARLNEWGIQDANGQPVNLTEANGQYDVGTAEGNRNRNLCSLGARFRQEDYPGTILPVSNVPC